MNEKRIKAKGGVSNFIAWIFISLQVLLMLGGIYNNVSPPDEMASNFKSVSFHSVQAILQSVIYLLLMNIPAIGALFLSFIVLLYHKNKKGEITLIVAIFAILAQIFLEIWFGG